MSVRDAIENLKEEMIKEGIQPETGLGTDLFLFSSTLAPVVNIDLLITNSRKQILLAWRNDPHCGTGWHFPGGCLRFKERLEERLQKTAMSELGTTVLFDEEPIKTFEIFSDDYREGIQDQRERAHFITLVYKCWLPQSWELERNNVTPGNPGYLRWFDALPENLLSVQDCYRASWHEISSKLWRLSENEQVGK